MKKIQINMSDEENKIVSLHKINNNLVTKEEAIKDIIKENYYRKEKKGRK